MSGMAKWIAEPLRYEGFERPLQDIEIRRRGDGLQGFAEGAIDNLFCCEVVLLGFLPVKR